MKNYTLTICLFLISAIAFSQYNVGFRYITVRDQSRFRNIITNIYYPAATSGTDVPVLDNGTKFPVVSFGHGFVMSSLAYQWLAQSLAAAGYIVSFPATEEGTPNHAEFGKDELFVARILRNSEIRPAHFYTKKQTDILRLADTPWVAVLLFWQ